MAPETYNYRKLLKEIADELTFSDVGSLKFVCRGKIGAAVLDKIANDKPLDLLKLLEERQFISVDNLTCLQGILKEIQRFDLVRKIPVELCPTVDVVDGGASVSDISSSGVVGGSVVSPYRTLLKNLADEMTSDNVDEMKYLLNVPGSKAEKLRDGEGLLTYLEMEDQLCDGNFSALKKLLDAVHRKDLIRKINEFTISEPLPPSIQTFRNDNSCYNMLQRPYGFALIINIKDYKEDTITDEGFVLNKRRGSDVDAKNLKDLWEQLGFTVESHKNLKAHQIFGVVQDMAKNIQMFGNSSCFVCCIMTHGSLGKIYGSDSLSLEIQDITSLFNAGNCPALEGKPKLFFIQACRGRKQLITGRRTLSPIPGTANPQNPPLSIKPEMGHSPTLDTDAHPATVAAHVHPVEAATPAIDGGENNDAIFRSKADPNEAHFLLGYSTAPGYVSFRSIDHGTWYVNALVEVFSTHYRNEDVMQMMVRVNGKVTEAYTSKGHQQCPAPVFTLAKKLYF